MPIVRLSPEAWERLKASCVNMFNPSPKVAAWMEANRPDEAEIMATLEAYYLNAAPTDGRIH